MKYAVEMGSGAMIYIQSFIMCGSGFQKLLGGGWVHIHRQHADLISLLIFLFRNNEIRLKMDLKIIYSNSCL
jgi:hypothetical protein